MTNIGDKNGRITNFIMADYILQRVELNDTISLVIVA